MGRGGGFGFWTGLGLWQCVGAERVPTNQAGWSSPVTRRAWSHRPALPRLPHASAFLRACCTLAWDCALPSTSAFAETRLPCLPRQFVCSNTSNHPGLTRRLWRLPMLERSPPLLSESVLSIWQQLPPPYVIGWPPSQRRIVLATLFFLFASAVNRAAAISSTLRPRATRVNIHSWLCRALLAAGGEKHGGAIET